MAKKKKGGAKNSVAKGVGAAVVIAFLLGMYTGIPGFGGGDGPSGEGGAAKGDTSAAGPITADDTMTKSGLEDEVVTVLIDGHKFAVLTKVAGESKYQPVPMDKVVSLAKLAKGDDSGVRVKVQRRETARMSAQEELRASLLNAGIPTSAVYWPTQLLP